MRYPRGRWAGWTPAQVADWREFGIPPEDEEDDLPEPQDFPSTTLIERNSDDSDS